ncbi:MAG: hypothetical protein KIT87_28495, partial [Anaerolineae bacterium]|nr:hypothetical protein [Anaerolineae bacterium]
MDLSPLKTAIRDRLRELQAQVRARAAGAVYHTLVASTLFPIVAAFNQGDVPTLIAAGQVLAGLGSNLLANKIQAWKEQGEDEVKADLARLLQADAEARAQAQQVVERLDTLALAQEGLSKDDRAWLAEVLNRELARQGVGRGVSAGPNSILVWGDRNVAIQGNADNSIFQWGPHSVGRADKVEIHVTQPAPPDNKAT